MEEKQCSACGRPFAAEYGLAEHNRLLDTISGQLAALLERTPAGAADSRELRELLSDLQQALRPRHGLCIDANCASCRLQEAAIKEHVMLYIDWKVPGTVDRLQEGRTS